MNRPPKRTSRRSAIRARVSITTLLPTSSKPRRDGSPRRWVETFWTFHEEALRDSRRFGDERADLRGPRQAFDVVVPLLRDDLSTLDLRAHGVRHGPPLESPLCAVRFEATATVEESAALAALASCKHAVAGLPHGGASAALAVDPAALSQPERERAARRLARGLRNQEGAHGCTLAPDVDLDEQSALWIAEEVRMRQPPPGAGGRGGLAAVAHQRGGPGEALRIVVEEALRGRGVALKGARVAVHGYGELGRQAAAALAQARARIVSIADGEWNFYHPGGIEPAILPALRAARGPVRVEGMLTLPASTVFVAPCEALVLTRPAPRITPATARRFSAKVVVEADDALLPPAADPLLAKHRVTVVPDVLGALGAPILHHLAWTQRRFDEKWPRREVLDKLGDLLREAYWRAEEASYRTDTTLRRAAHLLAAARLASAPES